MNLVALIIVFSFLQPAYGFECTGDQCQCATEGEFVNRNKFCDGTEDCSNSHDESDEICKFYCNDNASTIVDRMQSGYPAQVCDGVEDCPNASDEANCEFTKLYTCGDGNVITQHQICDGETPTRPEIFYCNDNASTIVDRMQSGYPAQVCDGVEDCPNGADESNCEFTKLFTCGDGNVITQHQICDGENDCTDGLDEFTCGKKCNVDQATCEAMDPGSGWQNRTAYIWNSCLMSPPDSANYSVAVSACNQFDYGHLVILDTEQKENEFHDIVVVGWDDTGLTWDFRVGQVSDPSIELPMYSTANGPQPAGEGAMGYVCQYDSLPTVATTTTATTTTTTITSPTTTKSLEMRCNELTQPHKYFGNSCFTMSSDQDTFSNANNKCNELGTGHLAYLADDAAKSAVETSFLFPQAAWVGAQYKDGVGWQWDNGDPFPLYDHIPNAPDSCVTTMGVLFLPADCNSPAPYICEYEN